ncbi:succinate dehydrogenase assembly factor 2 [Chthonobacter albigriseus]|uniref:FAD assembly factor SdhE n=1 Tax=Chthonobacter albigriseus TaxID=1683161 RepID=UPI0015EF9A17|nr:succinate dehydrogenase assembly factor 2 [Chthonobacter albigriseus]
MSAEPLAGLTRTSDDLDVRRRKALYHAWHRGTRELDLLLGRFADAHIADLSDAEMDEFERLMEVPDRDLFGWILGRTDTPQNYDGPVLSRVMAFAAANPLTG